MAITYGSGVAITPPSSGTSFTPLTPWIATSLIEKVRVSVETLNITSGCAIQAGYQVTNDPANPGLSAAISGASSISTNTLSYGSFTDFAGTVAGYQLVRFGARATTSSSQESAWVGLSVEIVSPVT